MVILGLVSILLLISGAMEFPTGLTVPGMPQLARSKTHPLGTKRQLQGKGPQQSGKVD